VTVTIEVRSGTFVPSQTVPDNRDGRRLGLALDGVALE
jgi:hypothetical protein